MQVECAHAARTVVGHPFNPPYLIPLVEVVGGAATAPEVVAWTSDFFRHAGKSVITMDREVPGFIANRLQEALWREALHMVAAGEATVEQIDLLDHRRARPALAGPGADADLPPRRRAGRDGAHARPLRAVAAVARGPGWSRPSSPPSCATRWSTGCEREAAGRSIDDLVAERDRGRHRAAAGAGPRVTARAGRLARGRPRRSGSTTTATSPSPTTCWCSGTPPTR